MLVRSFLCAALVVCCASCTGESEAVSMGSGGSNSAKPLSNLGGAEGEGKSEGVGGGAEFVEGEDGGGTGGGLSNDERSEDPLVAPVTFVCDEALTTKSPGMRRLTRRQYENTLYDLIALRLGDEGAAQVFSAIAPTVALLPEDERAILPQDLHGSYRRLDQTVQQSHVDYWYEIAVQAGEVLSQEQYVGALLGDCATDGDADNDSVCLNDFVRSFGKVVFRRPLSEDEVAHHAGFYAPSTGIDPLGLADVIGGLLTAPQFLYQIEHASTPVEGKADTFELAAFELASRLSYHFWSTMPDERLFELAESGELLDAGTFEAEVERLWDDPRTHETLRSFFREWMKLDDVPDMQRNNVATVFQNFAGDNLPTGELTGAMTDEIVDTLDYFTWRQPGGLEQIFTNNYSFAKSAELARLYGLSPWDGESEPPSFEDLRPGILTRAAFLSTGTPNTRPIMKGVFIRRNVLCDQIPPPPADVMGNPPELDSVMSTREVVEELTERPGTACAGCHATLMNPLGFATEGFDGLGRVRSKQQLFDAEGAKAGEAELDTSSMPQVLVGDEALSEGPEDLMTLIVDSGKLDACAARHYFRFTFGRWEKVVSDGCVLESMRNALEETGSLAGMLKSVALSDEFRQRSFNFDTASAEGGQ